MNMKDKIDKLTNIALDLREIVELDLDRILCDLEDLKEEFDEAEAKNKENDLGASEDSITS